MKASSCVYWVSDNHQNQFVSERLFAFDWSPGISKSVRPLNLASFHRAIHDTLAGSRHLEVSTYSQLPQGANLSAFNLALSDGRESNVSVEVAYQSSKRFRVSGRTLSVGNVKNSLDAKREAQRLASVGEFAGFKYAGLDLAIEQSALVFDLIYLEALRQNPGAFAMATEFDVFSDFGFNKNKLGFVKGKSMATQARSIAGAVGAVRAGLLIEDLIQNRMDTASSLIEVDDRLF